MKKAIFASIIMLATLTSCNNSESSINPEDRNYQTFQSTNASRESFSQEDADDVASSVESEMNGTPDSSARMRVLCFNSPRPNWGHACVQSGSGQIYGVDFNDGSVPPPKHDGGYYTVIGPRHYMVYEQDDCSCN